MKKEMNNKGFSLVELIIVIAIMAVLMGVLAPQFIKYVESSRIQKDASACSEVENAAQTALAIESVYRQFVSTGGGNGTANVTVKSAGGGVVTNLSSLTSEIGKIVPSTPPFTSRKFVQAGDRHITITLTADGTFNISNDYVTLAQ